MGVIISRTKPETFGEDFTHPRYNDYYIASHAKPNCRRCHGKGKLYFDNPTTKVQTVEACDCVFKR